MIPSNFRLSLMAALALIAMAWLAATHDHWSRAYDFTGQKVDYYNLLVDGFQEGYLYMKAEVHPDRLHPDIEVRKRAPYLLDASQYNGRYYLYFGVVPALLLFWPYTALTGHDCPPNLAVLLAAAGAFLVWVRLYREARARYFPTARAWFDGTAVCLMAFATGLPVLLVSGGMYEVALAWGCLFVALMTWALFRALHTTRNPIPFLALASLTYGLGVGSRPTVFLLGALVPLTAWLASRDQKLNRAILISSVLVPAGVIGLGLMFYNYARFGSVLEFGLNHQINPIAGTGQDLQRVAFIPFNLQWYYFTPPTFTAYFPYLFPHSNYPMPAGYYAGSEGTHGQLILTLLAAACFAAAIRAKTATPRPLRWFRGLLAFSFLVVLLATAMFCYRSSRYLVDFQPALVLLVVLTLGLTIQPTGHPGWRKRLWPAIAVSLATITWVFSLLGGFQFLDRFSATHPEAFRTLARYGNYPANWLARLGLHDYGPLRFEVTFSHQPTPVYEVLVATGAPGYKDVLFAAQYPNGYVDFILYHEGHGGARSKLIPVDYGRPYEIELDMGSLNLPAEDPFTLPETNVPRDVLRSYGRVLFEGSEVIRSRQSFYASSPGLLEFGRATGRPERPFSGRIHAVQRLPVRDTAEFNHIEIEPGVWCFELEFLPPDNLVAQPLLSSGESGKGNLLFLQNLPDGSIQFNIDYWGTGALASAPLPRPAPGRHTVEVFVGAQVVRHDGNLPTEADPAAVQAAASVVRVWLDGQPVWTAPLLSNPDSYDFVGIGSNTQGFSTATSIYGGWIQRLPLSPADVRDAVAKNLAPNPR